MEVVTGFKRFQPFPPSKLLIRIEDMKRSEFFSLLQPLTSKLYSMSYSLLPDDLQAEQLIIDSINAFLLRERTQLLKRTIDPDNKKEIQLLRRSYFKSILRYMGDIGVRRSHQLSEQMRLSRPENYESFFSLEPKVRFAMKLRYEAQFNVEEIEDILQIPRYEVIEKLHNGRFLLVSNLNAGVNV